MRIRRLTPVAALLSVALVTTALAGSGTAQVSAPAPAFVPRPIADPKPPSKRAAAERDPDTVLVKFKAGASSASRDAALARHGAQERGSAGATGYTVATLDEGTPEDAVRELEEDPEVQDAELNFVRRAFATPNDPGLSEGFQEYLKKIRSLAGWDLTKGSTALTIAILDTGIDTDHPDLATRIRAGYNAITGGSDVNDVHGHGTFVAGVAGAITNNGRGIAGAAWNTGIQPVKVLNDEGFGTDDDIAEGITWAADNGADVINLSLGAPGFSPVLFDAVEYAKSRNVVVVAAAGNDYAPITNYPAAFEGVLAVTATDNSSTFAAFSTFGWWVDVAAPGIGITSTYPGTVETYAIGSGTSFAAPLVAGVALLVRVRYPAFTQGQVHARIRNTARDYGPRGFDPFYGKGRLDAFAALGGAKLAPAVQPAGDALEMNPTADRAKAVGSSAVSASISPEGDADWFFREVGALGSITFTVTPPASNPNALRTREMDPVLEVYGPDLVLLGFMDQGFLGDAETVTVPVGATGRYYARVSNFGGSRTPANYTLRATTSTLGAPPPPPAGTLWVRDHTPADFSLNISTTVSPKVEFARDIDPASITTSTVGFLNANTLLPIAATRTYNAVTRTVTIDPTPTLARNTPFLIMVTGVTDTSGNTYEGLHAFRFKTVV